jgi:hypothetical protein
MERLNIERDVALGVEQDTAKKDKRLRGQQEQGGSGRAPVGKESRAP